MTASLKTDKFPYDMGDYLEEKSISVLIDLSNIWELIMKKEAFNLPHGFMEEMVLLVSRALYDQTNVVSLAQNQSQKSALSYGLTEVSALNNEFWDGFHECEWSVKDADMIMDKGREGLYNLFLRYGLKRGAERFYPARQQPRFQAPPLLESLQRIDGFLDMERGEGRPQICAELAKIQLNYLKPPKISTILDLTESVTQGELDWSEYVAAVRPLVQELQKECHE